MFWVERYMGVLKRFVRQQARPEGSMAEGWSLHECMYCLSEYLQQVDSKAPPSWREDQSDNETTEILCGQGVPLKLSAEEREALSTFVVYNSDCMQQWISKHDREWREGNRRSRAPKKVRNAPPTMSLEWLNTQIREARGEGQEISREEFELSLGCNSTVYYST